MIGIRNEIFTTPNPNLITTGTDDWLTVRSHMRLDINTVGVSEGEDLLFHAQFDFDLTVTDASKLAQFYVNKSINGGEANWLDLLYINSGNTSFPLIGKMNYVKKVKSVFREGQTMGILFIINNLSGTIKIRHAKLERGAWSPYVMGGGVTNYVSLLYVIFCEGGQRHDRIAC